MGAGFIIGGFCPGTSICAAAVGKIDGLAFVVGSFIGIFIFTEAYPLIKDIYLMENWGAVRLDKYMGISPELFAFGLTMIAIAAFFAVTLIENRVNKVKTDFSGVGILRNVALGVVPVAVIALLVITPSKQEYIQKKIREERQQQKCVFKEMSGDKLAYELINNHYKINLIDVRSMDKYKDYHLPLAINIPVDSMSNREWNEYFIQKHNINIFYADNDTTAKKACLLARFLGKSENFILKESTSKFRNMFFNIPPPPPGALKDDINVYRFRSEAATDMMNLENALKKFTQPVKKKVKKIQGGCS